MFEHAVTALNAILDEYPWVSDLGALLPLSALIDFLEIPPKFHIFQLAGAAPVWSWPVTPAASRLLLSDDHTLEKPCYLDRYGKTVALLGLDGRYGESYFLSSPQTVRLCVAAHRPFIIENTHDNMSGHDLRLQTLEVIHISRLGSGIQRPSPILRPGLSSFLSISSPRYFGTSILGWVLLFASIAMSVILETYISLAFLILMPLTGSILHVLYGSNPRRLLVNGPSEFSRLILVAEHSNAADWTVFYGESTILNSLLNRPLEPQGRKSTPHETILLRMLLRLFVVGQWGLALGAASLEDWNAYFITFWIVFCIFVHAYLIPPEHEARDWMESCAGIQLQRYRTKLSSRRALLNTIIALNPDTFAIPRDTQVEDRTRFYEGAMKWIDPILERGPSRAKWEQATLEALNEAASQPAPPDDLDADWESKKSFPSGQWKEKYQRDYWSPFIGEGILMAKKIRQLANLPGRKIEPRRSPGVI